MSTHPWWHFGRHSWVISTDEAARVSARAEQDRFSRAIMGTFEARELRTCTHCGRIEQRDVYGGGYIPHDWHLRGYI